MYDFVRIFPFLKALTPKALTPTPWRTETEQLNGIFQWGPAALAQDVLDSHPEKGQQKSCRQYHSFILQYHVLIRHQTSR
jgi:hypothetical protein